MPHHPYSEKAGNGEKVRHPLAGEARFRQLVDSISELGLFMLDSDGCILSWNSGAERLFGYTKDEVFGRNILFLYADENDNDDTSFEDAFLDRGGNVLEVRRRRKNGRMARRRRGG